MARKHLWSGSLFKITVQGKFFKKPDAKCLIFFKKNSKIQNNFSDLLATSVAVLFITDNFLESSDIYSCSYSFSKSWNKTKYLNFGVFLCNFGVNLLLLSAEISCPFGRPWSSCLNDFSNSSSELLSPFSSLYEGPNSHSDTVSGAS